MALFYKLDENSNLMKFSWLTRSAYKEMPPARLQFESHLKAVCDTQNRYYEEGLQMLASYKRKTGTDFPVV